MERVAVVTHEFFPKTCGVGDYALRITQELVRRGRSATIFTASRARPHPDAPAVPIAAGLGDVSTARQMSSLERSLDAFSPSLVSIQYTPHTFARTGLGSLRAARLAARLRRRGARVQVVLHELAQPWPRVPRIGEAAGAVFGGALRPDRAATSIFHRAELAALLASADSIVVTTEPRRQEVEALARVLHLAPRVDVVPVGANALPVPAEPPKGVRVGGGCPFVVGTFGTLDAAKRIDVVLGAFREVARVLPEAELVLIGDTARYPERLRALEAKIAVHPARARIRITGSLPLSGVAEEVSRLSVYLFPMTVGATTRSGTLPLPLGSGVPVVALAGPDSEPFRAGGAALLVDRLDAPAFAAATLKLARDPALAAQIVRAGRAFYDEQLSWPRIVDALLLAMG